MGTREMETLQAAAMAYQDLDNWAKYQLGKEARSEAERILFEGVYDTHQDSRARLRAHFGDQIRETMRRQVAAVKSQVEGEMSAAAQAVEREQAKWQAGLDRGEYAHQRQRADAKVAAAKSVADVRALVAAAKSRAELEALGDAMAAAGLEGRFADLTQRTEVYGLGRQVAHQLEAMHPTLTEAQARREQAIADAETAVRELQAINSQSGGLLNVELGLSPFSTADDGVVLPEPEPVGGMFG